MNSQSLKNEAQSNKQNGNNQSIQQNIVKLEPIKFNNLDTLKHYVVVQTKKKKQVIRIQSSQSQAQDKSKNNQTHLKQSHNQERTDKTKKIKKTVYKCHLCKKVGKKFLMKACMNCKHIFHSNCIQNTVYPQKRYICVKCKILKDQLNKERQKNKGSQQKQLFLQPQKNQPKKTQKEKKKQQYTKRLNQFRERYPYYFQDDQKCKYPIQDKLLIIYREIFQTNENTRRKPKQHPLIPSHLLADFLQIQNFFSTFQQELQVSLSFPKDLRKNYLYMAMNNEVIDQCYSTMLYCLIKIYLTDIFQKNKTDNVKMLNENCFFTLLTNMNQNDDLDQNIIVPSSSQFFRYLSTIPSMKKSFQQFKIRQKINLQTKVYILSNLIKGLSQIDTFHQLVAAKSQKMQNLTKQKGQLINQLKSDEAQNLQNKQKIKQFVNAELQLDQQLNKNDQNGTSISTRQLTRQKDKHKKKIQKLANQKDKSQRNIQQIKVKISQITKNIPFVTSQVLFIGKDRNQSYYFFDSNEPNRIYCQYHQYLFDQNNDFFIYEGKQAINQLVKSLNIKGLNERHLADTINYFIKEQIIYDIINQKKDNYSSAQICKQNAFQQIQRQDIVQIVLELEETFSNYLAMKNLQWSSVSERQNILANFKVQTDIQQIKRIIISIQQSFLFVQPMPEQPKVKFTVLDSDQQAKQDKKQSKKKSPVRLWGINSQRIKKYWIQYLQQCIDFKGIWICVNILKNYVDRYVNKKMQFLIEQQKKQQKLQKQKQRKQRSRLRKEKQDNSQLRQQRQRSRQKPRRGRPRKIVQNLSSQQMVKGSRPNLRERKNLKFQLDSDIQPQQQEQEYSSEQQVQESQSDDHCAICNQYGQMICCDSCPKVFHLQCLKIKQIPQGQWNCVQCLQKITNSRQTRSRAKNIKK